MGGLVSGTERHRPPGETSSRRSDQDLGPGLGRTVRRRGVTALWFPVTVIGRRSTVPTQV